MRVAAVFLALFVATLPQVPAPRVLKAHFAAGAARYQYLPFDVPAGTESLTITYSYNGDDGSSVVDLGLFEPGPTTLGTTAFRGYSGGSQKTITVGRITASPGYRTGPLPAGTWHVMLGLYRRRAGRRRRRDHDRGHSRCSGDAGAEASPKRAMPSKRAKADHSPPNLSGTAARSTCTRTTATAR